MLGGKEEEEIIEKKKRRKLKECTAKQINSLTEMLFFPQKMQHLLFDRHFIKIKTKEC